jgi:hypothetical protein
LIGKQMAHQQQKSTTMGRRTARLRRYCSRLNQAADQFVQANYDRFDLRRLRPRIHLALIVSTPLAMVSALLLMLAADNTPERILCAVMFWIATFVAAHYVRALFSAFRTILEIKKKGALG